MIISLDLPKFTLTNLFFLDTKKNMIMDGNFTKLLYSNELFVMNGLYLLFPIEIILQINSTAASDLRSIRITHTSQKKYQNNLRGVATAPPLSYSRFNNARDQ